MPFNWVHKNRSGLTLIEMMTTLAILLILVSILLSLISAGKRLWVTSSTSAANATTLQTATDRLVDELSRTTPGSVYYQHIAGFTVLTFVSAQENNRFHTHPTTGKPDWRRWIIYSLNSHTHELFRHELVPRSKRLHLLLTKGTHPPRHIIKRIINHPAERRLSENVSDLIFTFVPKSNNTVGKLTLQVEYKDKTGKINRYNIARTITIVN